MKTIKIIVFISLLISSISAFAQNQDTVPSKEPERYVITKQNGNEYIGVILQDDGREVLIETVKLGKIYIPKSEISSIVKIENDKEIVFGEYRSSGPFTTRYAFTTNSHPVKKGENYAMLNLYGPEVHFAVLDNLSIGVMSTWIASPMVLALKYSVKTRNPKLNFSVGTLMGSSGYLYSFRGYGGLHWASITYGDRMNNISLSGGYAYVKSGSNETPIEGIYYNRDPDKMPSPLTPAVMFSLAGVAKVGAKASFVFDSMGFVFSFEESDQNYVETSPSYYDEISGTYVNAQYTITVTKKISQYLGLMLMPGFRFQKNQNQAFQVSLSGVSIIGSGDDFSFPMPMCSWFYRF